MSHSPLAQESSEFGPLNPPLPCRPLLNYHQDVPNRGLQSMSPSCRQRLWSMRLDIFLLSLQIWICDIDVILLPKRVG